jgi:methyl-accepting chemotaxis protein
MVKASRSFRYQLSIGISLFMTLTFIVGFGYTAFELRQSSLSKAKEVASLIAKQRAQEIEEYLNDDLGIIRNMAHALSALKKAQLTDREAINKIMFELLDKHPSLIAIWSCWEPNAFDGKDQEYVGKPGHDATGRYIPYVNRASGSITLDPLGGYDSGEVGAFYQAMKQNQQETILDPYLYKIGDKEYLMTSLVVPIVIDNVFLGIVGVDLLLSDLQRMVEAIKPFERSYSILVSNNGTYVAHGTNPAAAGKSFLEANKEMDTLHNLKQKILEGKNFAIGKKSLTTGEMSHFIFNSLKVGDSTTPWSLTVSIPESVILHQAFVVTMRIVIIALISIAAMVIFVLNFSQRIAKPIQRITERAQRLAVGDLRDLATDDHQSMVHREDEIGEIERAFKKLTLYLEEKASCAREIADKNLTVDVNVSSPHDTLGHALQEMVLALHKLIDSLQETVKQVSSGAQQISESGQVLSIGTSKQASSLQQISSTLNEVASHAKKSEAVATETRDLAHLAIQSASAGHEELVKLLSGMSTINQSADHIKKIVKTIDSIAFQTNLLALNAAVEAARAGESGRGFAVVAEEVRNLAQRSGASVLETTKIVDETVAGIVSSNQLIEGTTEQFGRISANSQQMLKLVENVVTESVAQTQNLDMIVVALSQIDQVTQQTAANSEESAAAAQQLAGQAILLKEQIEQFKTKKSA